MKLRKIISEILYESLSERSDDSKRWYHGSDFLFGKFQAFKNNGPSALGIFATDDRGLAELFGAHVYQVKFDIKNPYKISMDKWDKIRDKHAKDTSFFESMRTELSKLGYDGVFISERSWTTSSGIEFKDGNIVVIFDPLKINIVTSENATNGLPIKEYSDRFSNDYKTWKKKNVTLRGVKEIGKSNGTYGSFGRGLYTVPLSNKSMASQYGNVYFVVGGIPDNPKVVDTLNSAEILRQKIVYDFCKDHGKDYDVNFFESHASMDSEMLKLGYDGLIIKGREIVNYRPDGVKYFKTEDELQKYYASLELSVAH
jgi:hypothetical protein